MINIPIYVEKQKPKKYLMNPTSLYISCDPLDSMFSEKMRLFPIRHYHPSLRKWEIPTSSINLIFKNFRNVVVKGELSEYQRKRFETLEEYKLFLSSLEPLVNFKFKTAPDPHQVEWFNNMLDRNRVILGDPMGLGKTKEYLDVCEYRRVEQDYQKILFICKSKHKYNMAKEIETHTNSQYMVVDGDRSKRLNQLREFYNSDELYYLVMGYESAAIHGEELRKIGSDLRFDGIILDEFNKIKNWGGRARKEGQKPHITIQITNLIECLNPELLIAGSGTPITKDPTDLYAVLRLCGAESGNIYQFKNSYCLLDNFGVVRGSKNEQQLHEKLWSVMIRRPKDLLELPEPRVSYIPVEMTPDQDKLYKAVQREIREELKDTKIFNLSHLAKITRLRQVTTDPLLVEGKGESSKILILDEYIQEVIENGEKAIIFSIYKTETKLLRERYKQFNPAYVDGDLKDREAMSEVSRFQEDQTCKLFIGSLHATKESYTLTAASWVFFLDLSWTVTDNMQAQDRAHRRGQDKTVNVVILYCKNSIDERVLDIQSKDATMISEIVDSSHGVIFDRDIIKKLLS